MSDVDEKLAGERPESKPLVTVSLTVEVTPKMFAGNEVICEIDPASGTSHRYVKGGLIKLPVAGQPYTITFQLLPGDVPGLQFDTADPFWSGNACPAAAGNNGQLSPQTPGSGTNLVVDATPQPPKNAIYYRLNFTLDGRALYCDPIIINN